MWSPVKYLEFADERSRPFFDLITRVAANTPETVVDLGCGPGHLTASLVDRWPNAAIIGIDSSPEMIERAAEHRSERVGFKLQDLRAWRPERPVEVIVSNAALPWVPDHRELLSQLLGCLTEDGWLAFQVPGNFGEPSHTLLRELSTAPRFAPHLTGIAWPDADPATTYLDDLVQLGCRVEAWETTYLHVLEGPDPVFRWISSTGARPVLNALPDPVREEFEREYRGRLRKAYPARTYGTVLPFRRIFVVAHKETHR
jgi:trans-aconitate 2-methyltransferase